MNTLVQSVPKKRTIAPRQSGFHKLGLGLFWNFAGLVLVALALPVALLFAMTSVPVMLCFGVWLADLGLLYALPRLERSPLKIGGVIGGILALSIFALVASQLFAATPPITDEKGDPLPGSVASLEKVNLNGSEQWITIRGNNAQNPVLLYLGAGVPGASGLETRPILTELEQYFVVVSWDMPGSGKSVDAVPVRMLNRERFVQDGYALTLLLRQRFHQDKIYLYGASWTSIVGIWLVQAYPELFHAYIGNGQLVNTTANDCKRYEMALAFATDRGDTASMAVLKRNGPPPYTGNGLVQKYLAYSNVIDDYGDAPRYASTMASMPMFMPEYGLTDKLNQLRGLYGSFETMYPQLQGVDFTTQAARLNVPVYLLAGRRDLNADTALVERYFNVLDAPHKELIRFDTTGYGLDSGSMYQVADVLVNKVLPQTQCAPRFPE